MQPSPSRSTSSKRTKKMSKQGTARQQQARARSGAERRQSGGTTPRQRQGTSAAGQKQSKKSKDTAPAMPHPSLGKAAGQRSSGLVHTLFTTRPPTPSPPDGPPPNALPLPVAPISPPPTLFSEEQLPVTPTPGQRQPVPTTVRQGSPAGQLGSHQTAPEAAIPSEEVSTKPRRLEATSRSSKRRQKSRPISPPRVMLAEQRAVEHGAASPLGTVTRDSGTLSTGSAQEASSEQQRVEADVASPAAVLGEVTFDDIAVQGPNAQLRRESVLLRRESLRLRHESMQLRLERRSKDPVFLIAKLIGPALDATITATSSGHLETGLGQTWVGEAKARSVLFVFLHCLTQALVNILMKQVVDIPKSKIAYYVAFGYMFGSMPEAFALSDPFGPRHVQVHLILRGLSSLISLMLKAEALRYLVVSDLAVAYTLVPVFVMVISWYFIGEGMGPALWISVLLCLSGIVIVMRPTIFFKEWDADTTQERLTGFMYAFGSSLSLVSLIVLVRVTQNATSRFVSFNSGLTRCILCLCMAMASGDFDQLLDGRSLATLVMMGKLSFCTIYFLNKALLTESGAFVATIKFSADIIFSVVLQMAFLDLYPDMWTLVGTALVVLSFIMIACGNLMPSLWNRRRHRRRSRLPPQPSKNADEGAASTAAAPNEDAAAPSLK